MQWCSTNISYLMAGVFNILITWFVDHVVGNLEEDLRVRSHHPGSRTPGPPRPVATLRQVLIVITCYTDSSSPTRLIYCSGQLLCPSIGSDPQHGPLMYTDCLSLKQKHNSNKKYIPCLEKCLAAVAEEYLCEFDFHLLIGMNYFQ